MAVADREHWQQGQRSVAHQATLTERRDLPDPDGAAVPLIIARLLPKEGLVCGEARFRMAHRGSRLTESYRHMRPPLLLSRRPSLPVGWRPWFWRSLC
jgi:hypothetical protein